MSYSASEVNPTDNNCYYDHKGLMHKVSDSTIRTKSTCNRKKSIRVVDILPKALPTSVVFCEYKQDSNNVRKCLSLHDMKALVANSRKIQVSCILKVVWHYNVVSSLNRIDQLDIYSTKDKLGGYVVSCGIEHYEYNPDESDAHRSYGIVYG
ncbi:hypothetical protein EWB00_005296 [Schistosoma japonicum]|uniref:Uncharacterized protein n=1 Tax=Schistosoma japonicum TaxID=6182 RepID=A0A4Z2D1Z2_SCHJA|nr:hypothetical protein EWB00_005296 [Schistosoma japonicum]